MAKQQLIESGVVVERGRKIDPTSERQKRLAAWEAKRASGVEVKRGRPKGQTNAPKPEQAKALMDELNELNELNELDLDAPVMAVEKTVEA